MAGTQNGEAAREHLINVIIEATDGRRNTRVSITQLMQLNNFVLTDVSFSQKNRGQLLALGGVPANEMPAALEHIRTLRKDRNRQVLHASQLIEMLLVL